MGEWLWWGLGSFCSAFAILKLSAGIWCLIELRRKWSSVPELWGVDWLDVVFRLEREFGVPVIATDFEAFSADDRVSLTAGQLWEVVTAKMRAPDSEVPADGWERVVVALSEALNVKPRRITADSRLYADLGMAYGLD